VYQIVAAAIIVANRGSDWYNLESEVSLDGPIIPESDLPDRLAAGV